MFSLSLRGVPATFVVTATDFDSELAARRVPAGVAFCFGVRETGLEGVLIAITIV